MILQIIKEKMNSIKFMYYQLKDPPHKTKSSFKILMRIILTPKLH